MLYVGNVIVNRVVADCTDFNKLRTIEQVIFHVQGGNYSFEAVQKGKYFIKKARDSERRLAKRNLEHWRDHPAKYALWYFNPLVRVPQHGTTNLLRVNLNNIVFTNQPLEHATVFIEDDKQSRHHPETGWCLLFSLKALFKFFQNRSYIIEMMFYYKCYERRDLVGKAFEIKSDARNCFCGNYLGVSLADL